MAEVESHPGTKSCADELTKSPSSNWRTRSEQAFRSCVWLSGTPIGNSLGGTLRYAMGSIKVSFPTWKIFLLFFGGISFIYSLLIFYLMPDNQANAQWPPDCEKSIATERVQVNQTVTSDTKWKWPQFFEAFKDPQTLMFFITAIGNTMPSTFASMFSSQIVNGFGFGQLETTLISTLPAATIQMGTFLVFSYLVSHRENIRLLLSLVASIPPLIGASLLYSLPLDNQAGRLAGYYLTYTHSMSFALSTGLIASNYAGSTKKSTATGFIYAGWAAGLVAGPQFFLESQAPNYTMAFEMLMVCYSLTIIMPIIQFVWYRHENQRRDRLAGSTAEVTLENIEFTDHTDFEQWETFRYTM